jgi:hypothetical protein
MHLFGCRQVPHVSTFGAYEQSNRLESTDVSIHVLIYLELDHLASIYASMMLERYELGFYSWCRNYMNFFLLVGKCCGKN